MTGTYNYARNQTPMVWQGAWVATLLYNPGATVSYGGAVYTALVTNTGVTPADGATWVLAVAGGGEQSAGDPGDVQVAGADGAFASAGTPAEMLAALGGARVVGPYVIDYTDFPGVVLDGVKKTIVTFPVGTVILDWWVDPATFVIAHQADTDDIDGFLGQGAAWTPVTPAGQWGEPLQTGDFNIYDSGGFNHSSSLKSGLVFDAAGHDIDGTAIGTSWKHVIADSSPLQLWLISADGLDDGGLFTSGHSELYFLICTPAAP